MLCRLQKRNEKRRKSFSILRLNNLLREFFTLMTRVPALGSQCVSKQC